MNSELPKSSKAVIEILTLTLKPDSRDQFNEIYVKEALPLLKKWKFRVVAHGPSLHDKSSYYIIRLFESLEARQRDEEAYYRSDDWRQGPRSPIMALIEHEAYTVVPIEAVDMWSHVIAKQK